MPAFDIRRQAFFCAECGSGADRRGEGLMGNGDGDISITG